MTLVAKGLSNTVLDASNPTLSSNTPDIINWASSRRFLPVQRFVVNDDSLPTVPILLVDHPNHAYTQLNGTGTFNTSSGHVVRFNGITGTTTKTGHNLVLTGDANYSSVQLTSDTAIPYTISGGTNLGNSGLDVSVVQDVLNQGTVEGRNVSTDMDGNQVVRLVGFQGTDGDPIELDSMGNPVLDMDMNTITLNPTEVILRAGTFYDVRLRGRATGADAAADFRVTSDRADTGIGIRSGFVASGSSNPNTNRYWGWSVNGVGHTNNSARVRSTAPVGTTLADGLHRQWIRWGDSRTNRTREAWIQFTGTPTADTTLTLQIVNSSLFSSGTLPTRAQNQTPTATFSATVTNNGVATASVATGTSTTARTIAVGASEVYPLGTNSSGSLTGSWVNVTPFTVTPTGSTPTGTGISLSTTALTNGSLSSIRLSTVTAPPTGTLYTHTISNSLELTEEIANAASTLGFTTAGNGYLNLSSTDNAARSASRTTMTISCWVKKSWIGSGAGVNAEGEPILSSANDSNNYTEIRLSTPTTAGGPTNASIRLLHRDNGTANIDVRTVDGQEFDWNEWTHVVVAVDTTQATPADRVKIYLNGILKEGSDLQTAIYPSLNEGLDWEGTIHTDGLRIGDNNIGNEFSGNIADFYYIDNQQLNATAFGTTNQTIWIPSNYTGTMNTASFHLDFSDAANLGNDTSSNNIDFSTVSSNFNVPRGSGPTITQASAQQSPNTPTNNIPNLLGADDVNSSSNVRFLNNGYTLAGPSGVTNNGRLVSTSGIFEDDRRYYFELYFQHRTGGTSSDVRPLLWPSTNSVQTATGNDLAFRNAFGGGTTVSSLRYYAIDTGTGDIWFASTSSSTTAYSDAFRMAVENADTGDPNFALNYKTLGITTDQLRFTYHDYTSNAGGSASTYVNLGQATMYNNPPTGYTTVVQGLPLITTNVNQVIAEQGTYAVANATQATGLFAENILHDANATGTFGGVTIAEVETTAPINIVNQPVPTEAVVDDYAGIIGLSVNVSTVSTPFSTDSGFVRRRRLTGSGGPVNFSLAPGNGSTRITDIQLRLGGNARACLSARQQTSCSPSTGNKTLNNYTAIGSYNYRSNDGTVEEWARLRTSGTTTTSTYTFDNLSGRPLTIQGTTIAAGGVPPVAIEPGADGFNIMSDGEWDITATNGTGGDIIVDPANPDLPFVRIQSDNTSAVIVIPGLTGPGPTAPAFDLDIATPAVTADGRPADSQSFAAFIDANMDPIPIAVETDGTVNMDTDGNPILGLDLSNFTGTFTTA